MMSDRKTNHSSGQLAEQLLNFPRAQRILMVADGSLDFGSGPYALGELVSLLQVAGHNITTAHRYGLGDNCIEGAFDFAHCSKSLTLDQYDQLWLFGFSATPLHEAERRAVAHFMDEGGGVFATGGHGLLGSGMGANLPRIRAMRKWVMSPLFDENSLDMILQRSPDATHAPYSDTPDASEKIAPVFLTSGGDHFLMPSWYPHPVLRHPEGVIDTLPFHSLASECLEPKVKAGSFFAGIEEWPADSTKPNQRPGPVVVAKSNEGQRQWGSISIYDGDNARVGRILCDASWRRFINLNASATQEHPADHSPESTQRLNKLHRYYLNIAHWLAPRARRAPWHWLASILARADIEGMGIRHSELEKLAWAPLVRTGTLVEERISRQYGPGASEELIGELLHVAEASPQLKSVFSLRTPAEIIKQGEQAGTTLLLPRHLIRRAILGASAHALLQQDDTGQMTHEQWMKTAMVCGVRYAELALAEFMSGALHSTREFVRHLRPQTASTRLNNEPAVLD